MEIKSIGGPINTNKRRMLCDLREVLIKKLSEGGSSINDPAYDTVTSVTESLDPFPLVEMQEAFLVSRHLTRKSDYVGCHIYLEFSVSELNVKTLKKSWDSVIQRHMMLRTKICSNGKQKIVDDVHVDDFKFHDASVNPEQTRKQMSARVYEPEQWPLFDIQITEQIDSQHIIHFSIDEWIADGPSLSIILEDWYRFYHGNVESMRPLRSNFREYQEVNKTKLAVIDKARDLAYWKNKLAEIPQVLFPNVIKNNLVNKPLLRARYKQIVEPTIWELIKRKCKNLSISPTAFLLTIYSYVISSMENKTNIPLAVTVSNRVPIVPDVESLVGPFMSTSIFMSELSSENIIQELLEKHQKQIWLDLDHSLVSGIGVLRELKAKKLVDRAYYLPFVFTSMLGNFYKSEKSWFSKNTYFVTQTPQVYLDHQVYEKDGQLVLNWDVADDMLRDGIVEHYIDYYMNLVHSLSDENISWGNTSLESISFGSDTAH